MPPYVRVEVGVGHHDGLVFKDEADLPDIECHSENPMVGEHRFELGEGLTSDFIVDVREVRSDTASTIESEEPELKSQLDVDEDIHLKKGEVELGRGAVIGLELKADSEIAAEPEDGTERNETMPAEPVLDK